MRAFRSWPFSPDAFFGSANGVPVSSAGPAPCGPSRSDTGGGVRGRGSEPGSRAAFLAGPVPERRHPFRVSSAMDRGVRFLGAAGAPLASLPSRVVELRALQTSEVAKEMNG